MSMQRARGGAQITALACAALLVMTGCDSVLEVDLPDAVTEEALDDPGTASLQVNSVSASFECAFSSFAIMAAGHEDNFQRYIGVGGNYAQYVAQPGLGSCDGDVFSTQWMEPLLIARGQGYSTWSAIQSYTIPNKAQLLAKLALYNGAIMDVFGEYLCEFAIDGGPMLTYSQTLDIAEGWADSALAQIDAAVGAAGTFPINTQQGQVTSDIRQTVLGLKSRIRYANGDLTGAAVDASSVADGHMAWVLRETGEDRRNMVSSTQGFGGGTPAAGFLQGAVALEDPSRTYWISALGSHPVTGVPWPNPVPFTGYIDLAIETATGRAVSDAGNALTLADPGTEKDTRVEHVIGSTGGGQDYIIQKYKSLDDDIPLVNWREMRLIEAEALGNTQAGIDVVNQIRTADGLPGIGTGADTSYRDALLADADLYDGMIIEERRRSLWLEGRFWSTKILKNEKLWFPRAVGEWVNSIATNALGGGVRVLLPNSEYQINTNLSLDDRGTGCPAGQRPVFN
ncbi:MAG: hypothetical protein PVJ80_06395 [Gemmatimonadota bacterium]